MNGFSINRFLVLMFIGLMIFDVAMIFAMDESFDTFYQYVVLIPLFLALLSQGGKVVYYLGLLVSAFIGLFIALFALVLVMDVTGFEPIDYDQDPMSLLAMFVLVLYGSLGITCWFVIRATHPAGPGGLALNQTVGGLWMILIFSILFVIGINFAIMMLAVSVAGWGYSEIIWIYYLDTLAYLVISSRAMNQLQNFEMSDEAKAQLKSPADYKRDVITGYWTAGGVFLLIYAVLFGFTLVPPSIDHIFYMLLITLAFVALHYNEFRVKLPRLEAERPELEKLQQSFGTRILPMHLTAMLAMGFIFADDAEMRSLTLMVVFVFLKVIGDIISEIVEFVRESRMMMGASN